MCILSERRGLLNQEAPLAKKLHQAYHTLEELRDVCRENPNYADGLTSAKDAIFLKVQQDNLLADIEIRMGEELSECIDYLKQVGLSAASVMGDADMLGKVVEMFHKLDGESDYWDIIDSAVMRGVKEVLESRSAQ
jgi:hypothetical protein